MMEPRLKKLEAIAGMPKTFFAFNIPMTSAASETRRMKGNMIRVSKIVSSACLGGEIRGRGPDRVRAQTQYRAASARS